MFFYMFSLKSRLFQDFPFNYTPDWTIWSSKSKKFSGEGLKWAPSLDRPLRRSFSGFALNSGFALKSQALRTLDSGFALFGPPQLSKRGCALGWTRWGWFRKAVVVARRSEFAQISVVYNISSIVMHYFEIFWWLNGGYALLLYQWRNGLDGNFSKYESYVV